MACPASGMALTLAALASVAVTPVRVDPSFVTDRIRTPGASLRSLVTFATIIDGRAGNFKSKVPLSSVQ
eukprot:2534250-Amphidinium_carterae.1